jgi:hypothetical protein
MACLDIPIPALPTLGLGLSIEPPALPSFSGDLALCCKILQFTIVLPPIPLPPLVINASTTALMTAATAAIQTYLDLLPLECPLE